MFYSWLGINAGLRISDLLRLKETDVQNDIGKIKDRIELREKKTGKVKNFPISDTAAKALREYLPGLPTDTPLFPLERVPALFLFNKPTGYLTRLLSWLALRNESVHIPSEKFFRYQAYKAGYLVERLQKIFNHSSSRVTLAYIGITQDDTDEVYLSLNL